MKCAVVGGAGALGRALISHLKEQLSPPSTDNRCSVVSIDLTANEEATENVLVRPPVASVANLKTACEAAAHCGPFDAIFCVAGGWCGGGIDAPDDLLAGVMAMYERNVLGAALGAAVAGCSLRKETGSSPLLVFTSAKASLGPTPGMIAYGMAKAATNHLVGSLAQLASTGEAALPASACVLAILPETLDTAANRQMMPKADTRSWTPLSVIAGRLTQWLVEPKSRPANGSLVTIVTRNHETVFTASGEERTSG